jgi:hypothetical protein
VEYVAGDYEPRFDASPQAPHRGRDTILRKGLLEREPAESCRARRREGTRPANWHGFGLSLFASADGKLRGILTFTGTIPSDLVEAFTQRWPTEMRVIQIEELRTTIYNSMKPSVISDRTQRRAAARLSIWARRPKFVEPRVCEWDGEALPVIIA